MSGSPFLWLLAFGEAKESDCRARHERDVGTRIRSFDEPPHPSPLPRGERGLNLRFAWFTYWIPGTAEDDGSYGLTRQYLCNVENS